MIIEFICNFFFSIAETIINLFPSINIEVPTLESILHSNVFFRFVWYLVPVPTILWCCSIYFSLEIARLVMAIIVRVKSFIPFFSGD